MNPNKLRIKEHLQVSNFKALFREELGWDNPKSRPFTIDHQGQPFTLTPLAEKRSVQILLCSSDQKGRIPDDKTLSFSKDLCLLKASTTLEDALYNFTRPVRTLRVELPNSRDQARWQQRTPAMAAGLTDHIWTVKELLTVVLVPLRIST